MNEPYMRIERVKGTFLQPYYRVYDRQGAVLYGVVRGNDSAPEGSVWHVYAGERKCDEVLVINGAEMKGVEYHIMNATTREYIGIIGAVLKQWRFREAWSIMDINGTELCQVWEHGVLPSLCRRIHLGRIHVDYDIKHHGRTIPALYGVEDRLLRTNVDIHTHILPSDIPPELCLSLGILLAVQKPWDTFEILLTLPGKYHLKTPAMESIS